MRLLFQCVPRIECVPFKHVAIKCIKRNIKEYSVLLSHFLLNIYST